ncbi:MAG TPA: hypothetical protein VII69_11385 [Candidatus Eremiobacteraceae bacterium]
MNQTVVNVILGVIILAIIVFRVSRERKFGMGSLWVWPAVMLVLVVVDIWVSGVSSTLDIVYMFIALVAGTAFGWFQGIHSTIRVDRSANAAFVKSSPIGMGLFIAALAFRLGARYMAGAFSTSAYSGGHLSPAVALMSAITLVFAVGLFTGLRLYVKRTFDDAPA